MIQPENNISDDSNHDFESLLVYLKNTRGFDFTGYKRSTLLRRVAKRLELVEIASYRDYVDHLEVHPDEFGQLFNTILINVTSFFRDPAAWEHLATEIVPKILSVKYTNEPIRIWSAGCASGEEAYTLAMVFAECIGLSDLKDRVKIYATDIDDQALNQARQASYTSKEVAGVPPELLGKYFDSVGTRFHVKKDLRRQVIFGRHDLVQDAPISRIQLLVCRNTLMYLNSEVQAKVLSRFHFSLCDKGYLFMGNAEMLFTHSNIFTPIDVRQRIFVKSPRLSSPDRTIVASSNGESDENASGDGKLIEAAFNSGPIAQIAIDPRGQLVMANDRARSMFRLGANDIGRLVQDLELSYRPVELRSLLEQAFNDRRIVVVRDVSWSRGGETIDLEIQVATLYDAQNGVLGASVTFNDVSRHKALQDELQEVNHKLEAAYEELQSTNEELETTNEEMQSTNEELETTNEELQSTNEELETINEEMQSTNEELQTINDELRRTGIELNQINAYTDSILHSVPVGVVVVDSEMRVKVWNHKSEDLWGMRADEVIGRHFLNLDIGLTVEALRQPIRQCMRTPGRRADADLTARNRLGKDVGLHIMCSPLVGADESIVGAILIMEEINKA